MFDTLLSEYKNKGCFSFSLAKGEKFGSVCNAPSDKAGVYLIYKLLQTKEELIYIGSSGQKTAEGVLKVRNGGMKDRLVNGYHPNQFGISKRTPRRNAFPMQMEKEGISEIKIYWWVTYDAGISDFPTDVETALRNAYLKKYERLPSWHRQKQ